MNDLPSTTKRCLGSCGRELPTTEEFFNKHPSGKYGLQPRCRDCKREENRIWQQTHPEKKREQDRKYAASHPELVREMKNRYYRSPKGKKNQVKFWLSSKYGLTEDQYQTLWNQQDGLCAICNQSESEGKRLHIDHDHKRNVVRGLLCGKCNRGIGMFDDNHILLIKAIGYLEQPEKRVDLPVKVQHKPRQRDDVSTDTLRGLRETGLSFEKIGEIVGLSGGGVRKRLLHKATQNLSE